MEVIEPATLMSKCHDPIRLTTATRPISQKYLLSSVNFMKSPRTCDSRCTPWIEGRPIIDINTRCLIVAFHCYNDRNRLCWWTDTRNNTTLFHLSHWLPVAHRVTAIESETPGFYPLRIMSLHHLFYCSVAQPVFWVPAARRETEWQGYAGRSTPKWVNLQLRHKPIREVFLLRQYQKNHFTKQH